MGVDVKRAPLKIILGETAFDIRPLQLRQIEEIETLLFGSDGGTRLAISIVAVALQRDHSEVRLDDVEATGGDITKAMSDVLRHAGFLTTDANRASADGS